MRWVRWFLMGVGAFLHLAGVLRVAWLDEDPSEGWRLLAIGAALGVAGSALCAWDRGRSPAWGLWGALGAPGMFALYRLRWSHEIAEEKIPPLGPEHFPRFDATCPWCGVRMATGAQEDGPFRRIASSCGAVAIGAAEDDRAALAGAAARCFEVAGPEGVEEREGGWARYGSLLRFRWFRAPSAPPSPARRLESLVARAEEGYDRLYDAGGRPDLGGITDDFIEAIALAKQLGLATAAQRLEKRMEQVRATVRSQAIR